MTTVTPKISLSLYTVPARAPLELSASAENSTSISITWSSLEDEFRNGVLLNYSLNVIELNSRKVYSLQGNVTRMVLSSLHPYYTYEISVAAATRHGTGPFSRPVLVTTNSDGEP